MDAFLILLSEPSESRLFVTVDVSGLPSDDFLSLVWQLQDTLECADLEYSRVPDRLRGRSLLSAHRKLVQVDKRMRYIRFSPFPSSFINTPKTVRRALHRFLQKHAIVVKLYELGFQRNIYLATPSTATKILQKADQLNQKIDALNKQIKEYQETPNYKEILDILSKHGLTIDKDFHVTPISITLLPTNLHTNPNPDNPLEKAITKAKQKIMQQARKHIKQKAKKALQNKKATTKQLRKLQTIAKELGLTDTAKTIAKLIEIAENPNGARQKYPDIEQTIKTLLDQL